MPAKEPAKKPAKRKRACPKCGTKFEYESVATMPSYPFCSERCRMIDLGSWLNEDYRVVEDIGNDLEQVDEYLDRLEQDQAMGDFDPNI